MGIRAVLLIDSGKKRINSGGEFCKSYAHKAKLYKSLNCQHLAALATCLLQSFKSKKMEPSINHNRSQSGRFDAQNEQRELAVDLREYKQWKAWQVPFGSSKERGVGEGGTAI